MKNKQVREFIYHLKEFCITNEYPGNSRAFQLQGRKQVWDEIESLLTSSPEGFRLKQIMEQECFDRDYARKLEFIERNK